MTQQAISLISDAFGRKTFIQAVFSSPRSKADAQASKISIRPITIKGELVYQVSAFTGTQVLHSNLKEKECLSYIEDIFSLYKQALVCTKEKDYHFLISKKGEARVLSKPASKSLKELSHNRPKEYLLSEGAPLPFLIKLGIMNTQGKVLPAKMDKFRQINRFLEMVDDTLPSLDQHSLRIIDFGCGKAYLTFALYHYLHHIKKIDVSITGLDLKADVIKQCQDIADSIGYKGLTFLCKNIADYTPSAPVDMVVSLHACNTATDYALEKAVNWKARVILSAPCCQHELYNQIHSDSLEGLLQYGILKERFAALATDAARAQILEIKGYSTQILEFIDSEHTPKNLLIRAVWGSSKERQAKALVSYLKLKKELKVSPTLELLMGL